jgi:sugar/nucleoside kinase (ribokinase family)
MIAAVVGGAAWNHLVRVPHLPRDLTTLHATGHRHTVGGTGAGKALHLARLGVRTRLHALLGEDHAGERVRAALADAGVELTWWPDPAGTERHLNLMDPHGERVSIFLDHSSPDPAVPAEDLLEHCRGADAVFVSLVPYARRLLPLLPGHGTPVWADLHDWDGENPYHRDWVRASTHLFLSDVRLPDADRVARTLAEDEAAPKELVVLTRGARGATAYLPGEAPLEVPPRPAGEVVDTNGAGDAFGVGVAWARDRGWDWERCLEAGAVLAGGCVATEELADPELTPAWLLARLS